MVNGPCIGCVHLLDVFIFHSLIGVKVATSNQHFYSDSMATKMRSETCRGEDVCRPEPHASFSPLPTKTPPLLSQVILGTVANFFLSICGYCLAFYSFPFLLVLYLLIALPGRRSIFLRNVNWDKISLHSRVIELTTEPLCRPHN